MLNIAISAIVSLVMVAGAVFFGPPSVFSDEYEKMVVGQSQSISSLSSHATPIDADSLPIVDSAAGQTKRVTWANVKATAKTYFDTLYSTKFTGSDGLATILSDESGTGDVAYNTDPILLRPSLSDPTINTPGTEAKGELLYVDAADGGISRLLVPPGAGYWLTGSSSMDRPAWDNSVASFPYTASSTFTNTVVIDGSGGLAIGTAATSTGNLLVSNNASTTNLTVSRSINFSTGSSFVGFASSTGYEIKSASWATSNSQGQTSGSVSCTSGKKVIGGGVVAPGAQVSKFVCGSYPGANEASWTGVVCDSTNGAGTANATVYAICITP